MKASERRLLVALLVVVSLAATGVHAVLRWEPGEPPPEAPATPKRLPPNETELLALGAGAQTLEPTSPVGSWRFVWRGSLNAVLGALSRAESSPGGYWITLISLRRDAETWTLETVLSPWQEGLVGSPPGKPSPPSALVAILGVSPPRPRASEPPNKVTPAVLAPPAPEIPPRSGEVVLLGSFGEGGERRWWFKETASDRVFEVPGADDWTLVQADGAAIILQKAGQRYRVELSP